MPKLLNAEAFFTKLRHEFPEIGAELDRLSESHTHLRVALIRQIVEDAIDTGRLWQAEQYCRFIERHTDSFDAAMSNAVAVSFVEDFALGEITEQRHSMVLQRMPKRLRAAIVQVNGRWR